MTNYIVLGVYEEELLEPMAEVLKNLGVKHALIVFGDDRLDELSISSTSSVCEIKDGKITKYKIDPEELDCLYILRTILLAEQQMKML